MIKEAIKKIKENNNISYKEILLRASLPLTDRNALNDFILGNRSYPVEKIDKILEAFGVEIIVKKMQNGK